MRDNLVGETSLAGRKESFNRTVRQLSADRLLQIVMGLAICIVLATLVNNRTGFATSEGVWSIAKNVASGRGYTECSADYFPFCGESNKQTAMREPISVFLMTAGYLISPSQVSGIVIQCILYLGTLLVIFVFLRENDRRVAGLAALLWTVSIPVLELIKTDSGALACAFFLSIGLVFFQKGRTRGGTRYWLLSAVFFGFASLSRSVILVIPPALAVALWLERRHKLLGKIGSLVPSLIFLAAFLVVLAPWVVRNEIVFGRPVMGSTLTGYNILRMNYMLSNPNFVPHYVGSSEFGPVLTRLIQQSSLTGKENEAQMQNFYMQVGLRTLLTNPVGFVRLSAFRFLSLWFNTSVEAAYGYSPTNLEGVIEFTVQLLLLVALVAGAILNRRAYWPLYLSLALVCAAYMAIDAQVHYLVDVMPVIVMLAASILPAILRLFGSIRPPVNTSIRGNIGPT